MTTMAGHAAPPVPGTERHARVEADLNEAIGQARVRIETTAEPLPATGTDQSP